MGTIMGVLPRTKDILSLIRFRNLLIGGATVLTGSYVSFQNTWSLEIILNVILQMISVSSFMAAGNILNDIIDIEIDKMAADLIEDNLIAAAAMRIDHEESGYKYYYSMGLIEESQENYTGAKMYYSEGELNTGQKEFFADSIKRVDKFINK